ncbi:MAG: hypothetical protein JSV81_00035 [Anaerolineales bacterium]|nr:MAG: hypothetical protein JSV81_00035 [Anaerolineales bacterium]
MIRDPKGFQQKLCKREFLCVTSLAVVAILLSACHHAIATPMGIAFKKFSSYSLNFSVTLCLLTALVSCNETRPTPIPTPLQAKPSVQALETLPTATARPTPTLFPSSTLPPSSALMETSTAEIPAQPEGMTPTVIHPKELNATWRVLSELGDKFRHIAAEPSTEVWAIGEDGLFRFDGQAWSTFSLPPGLNKKIQADPWQINDFIATSDNGVWVGTRQDGLYHFGAGTWTHTTTTGDWPYQGVDHLALDTQNRLWAVLHNDGVHRLFRFDGQTWLEFAPTPVVDVADLAFTTGLAVNPTGEVWLSIRGSPPYQFNGVSWFSVRNSWLGDTRDVYLAANSAGQIWVGNSGAWLHWTGQGWQIIKVTIPAPFSYPVAVDAAGGAWGLVTSNCYWCKIPDYNQNGAVYVTLEQSCRFTAADGLGDPPIDPLPDPVRDSQTPRPDQVWDIAVAADGRVWFITQGKLTVFNPQGPVCNYAAAENVRTPEPADLSKCTTEPKRFLALWQERIAELGCPIADTGQSVPMAEQSFERGWMLWRGDTATIIALPVGQWYREFEDTWNESQPIYSCLDLAPAQTPPTPRRGFGKIWCTQPELRDSLGQATSEEHPFTASIQSFEWGLIFSTDQGITYIFERFHPGWERLE